MPRARPRLRAIEPASPASGVDRLGALMRFSGAGMIGVGSDGRIECWNPAAEKMFGYAAGEVIGEPIRLLSPPDRLHEADEIDRKLRAGEIIDNLETVRITKDGHAVDVLLSPAPIFSESGEFRGSFATLIDISDRKAAAAENARLAAILQTAGIAIGSVGRNGLIETWNPAAERLFGYTEAEIVGQPIDILVPPDRKQERDDVIRRMRSGEVIAGYETIRIAKDGRPVDVLLSPAEIHFDSGAKDGISMSMIDITERKAAERTQKLLIDEINHRVKNTLNVLQAIAQQSLLTAKDPAHFVDSFSGRVQALSRVHGQLTAAMWAGTDLDSIVEDQVARGSGNEARIDRSGPAVELRRSAAVNLALVLHELATNARKFGALSVPDGRIGVSWTVQDCDDDRILDIAWRESGGPPVPQPVQPGFGTKLIERSLSHGQHGVVKLDFEPAGVRCDIRLSLRPRGTGNRTRIELARPTGAA